MSEFIDDDHPILSWLLWIVVVLTVGFILREIIVYGYMIVMAAGHALLPAAEALIIKALASVSASVEISFALSLIAAAGIPAGVVIIYKVMEKEHKPKAWISAIGVFLNPIFVDFFKDVFPGLAAGKDNQYIPGLKVAISIVFATIFLIATKLFGSKGKVGKVVAALLYLTPLFVMIGYIINFKRPSGIRDFFIHIGAAGEVGLVGLLLTACYGIFLSRLYASE